MTLQVALVIGGDASGAKSAAADTKAAVVDLTQQVTQLGNAQTKTSAALQAGMSQAKQAAGATVIPFNQAAAAIHGTADAAEHMSTQALALGHAVRSGIEGLISGQQPTQILAQQLNHLTYAASGEGGLAGAFGQLTGQLKNGVSWLGAILSPAAIATTAVLTLGAGALLAASQWGSAQQQIALGLTGSGRASGLTVGGVNGIANQSSSLFGLSVSEAREFATQLAATGKIGKDNIAPIVQLGHDVATAYGVDATKAAQLLAKAFVDPAKGAQDLNQRLGFLDAAMQQQISDLQAQGQLYAAQKVLQAGMQSGLDGVGNTVSSTAKFWTALGNAISNVWDKFGEGASRVTGIGFTEGLDDKIAKTKANIDGLQKQIDNISSGPAVLRNPTQLASLTSQLDRERASLIELNAQWDAYQKSVADAQARRDSFAQAAAVRGVLPEIGQHEQLQNQATLLSRTLDSVNQSGGAQSPILKSLGVTYDQLAQSVTKANAELDGFKSAADKTTASLQLSIAAVSAKGPQARGDIAYQQFILSAGQQPGKTSPDVEANAQLQRTLTIKQIQQQISDQEKAQLLSAQQRVQTAGLELGILGQSSVEQERQRALLQAKQQLEQEALRTYGNRDAYDRSHLDALTQQINKESALKQLLVEQQAQRDITFERSQIGRDSDEQQIATKLRSIYGDDYQNQLNGSIASQMRLNQTLQLTHDAGASVFRSIAQDAAQGKLSMDSFGNAAVAALGKITDKLADMAFNNLWNAAFGGNQGGGFNLFSLFGGGSGSSTAGAPLSLAPTGVSAAANGGLGPLYADGGYTGNAGRGAIAGLVHGQEFVVNAEATARHLPLLQALNDGTLTGYAGGGYVGSAPRQSWSGGYGAQPIMLEPKVTVNSYGASVDTSVDDQGNLELTVRALARDEIGSSRTNGVFSNKYGLSPRPLPRASTS